jgi:hypothetical protein
MTEEMSLEFSRRGAWGMILAGVAVGSSRADACTIAPDVMNRDEIVAAFVALCARRDADRLMTLLADDFTFRADLDETPLDREGFLAWMRARPPANKDGFTIQPIYADHNQVVQREFVRFVDLAKPTTSCGNLGNFSLAIAVYELAGWSDPYVCVTAPCPPDPRTGLFNGTRISTLHHIRLPFSREN